MNMAVSWCGERTFYSPSSTGSVIKAITRDAEFIGPCSHAHRLAVERQRPIRPSITTLQFRVSPSAIARAIVSACIIDPIDTVVVRWALTHVFKEIHKQFPTRIECAVLISRIMSKSQAHSLPASICRVYDGGAGSFRLSMSKAQLSSEVPLQTSATSGVSPSQASNLHAGGNSTIADAEPQPINALLSVAMHCGKSAESLTGNIKHCWHTKYNSG